MKKDLTTWGNNNYERASHEDVLMPVATVGQCTNYTNCRQFNTDLANGYCTPCWDKGLDTFEARKIARDLYLARKKRKKAKGKKSPAQIREANKLSKQKSRRRSVQGGGSTYMTARFLS